MHGPSTNTGRCITKENLEGLALSDDSPLDKTVLNTAQQLLHCLEQLSTHKGEIKELEGPMQICNLIMSSKKKPARMYKNYVESLR